MNRLLRRFWGLSGAERRLVFRAGLELVRAMAALRLRPARTLQSLRYDSRKKTSVTHRFAPETIAWAVSAVSGYLPGSTCLVQAVAARRLLWRDGHEGTVQIGVIYDAAGLRAHAWIENGGRIILGDRSDMNAYAPMLRSDVREGDLFFQSPAAGVQHDGTAAGGQFRHRSMAD